MRVVFTSEYYPELHRCYVPMNRSHHVSSYRGYELEILNDVPYLTKDDVILNKFPSLLNLLVDGDNISKMITLNLIESAIDAVLDNTEDIPENCKGIYHVIKTNEIKCKNLIEVHGVPSKAVIKLYELETTESGVIRLQSQLMLHKNVADFIIEDGVLGYWDGYGYAPFNQEVEIVKNIEDMKYQPL